MQILTLHAFFGCNKLVIEELKLVNQIISSNAFNGVTINKLLLASDKYTATNSYNWSNQEIVRGTFLTVNFLSWGRFSLSTFLAPLAPWLAVSVCTARKVRSAGGVSVRNVPMTKS